MFRCYSTHCFRCYNHPPCKISQSLFLEPLFRFRSKSEDVLNFGKKSVNLNLAPTVKFFRRTKRNQYCFKVFILKNAQKQGVRFYKEQDFTTRDHRYKVQSLLKSVPFRELFFQTSLRVVCGAQLIEKNNFTE